MRAFSSQTRTFFFLGRDRGATCEFTQIQIIRGFGSFQHNVNLPKAAVVASPSAGPTLHLQPSVWSWAGGAGGGAGGAGGAGAGTGAGGAGGAGAGAGAGGAGAGGAGAAAAAAAGGGAAGGAGAGGAAVAVKRGHL